MIHFGGKHMLKKSETQLNKEGLILFYETENGKATVNVRFENETFWLTQKAMTEIFDVDKSSVSRHLRNIFDEGELDEKVVVAKNAITTQHGALSDKTQTSETMFYNLDAVISVGYRVNWQRFIS